jgi:hypothetical protein
MSSLADYLAKNYLSADPNPAKKSKKRKRKDVGSTSSLVIADDDVSGWDNKNRKDDAVDDNIIVTSKLSPSHFCGNRVKANFLYTQHLVAAQNSARKKPRPGLPSTPLGLPHQTKLLQMP